MDNSNTLNYNFAPCFIFTQWVRCPTDVPARVLHSTINDFYCDNTISVVGVIIEFVELFAVFKPPHL